MLKIVCIYDYGTGNHSSVENAIKKLGSEVLISNNIDVLKKSDGIIFPGVGSFPMAMNNLNKKK